MLDKVILLSISNKAVVETGVIQLIIMGLYSASILLIDAVPGIPELVEIRQLK